MQFFRESHEIAYSIIFAAVLSGCGGGGESVDADPGASTPPAPPPAPAPVNGVELTDHGGNCNGSFDNTTAIANGIAAAQARNVPLLIPAGQCNFSQVIELSGAKIQGEGSTSVLYATNWQQASIFMRGAGPSVSMVKLTGAPAPGRQAPWEMTKITVVGATDFVIDSVTIENSPAASIQTAQGATRGRITNSTIRNSLSDSIHITDKASFITVESNLIEASGDDGIAVVSYRSDGARVNNITARNNTVRNNKHGRNMSVVGGSQVLYENNLLQGNPSWACLYMAQENSSKSTYSVLDVQANRNTLQNCGSTKTAHAAAMVYSDGAEANNNITLLGNDIIQSGQDGIRYFGAQTNIRLDQNRITGARQAYVGDGATVIPHTSGSVGYVAP
jgi:hypothetical protein